MNQTHPTPTAAREPAAANPNGQPTLSDRVRALRLKGDGGGTAPRSTWLPWGLTLIALAMSGVFAWRAYRLTPADVGAQGENVGDGKAAAPGTATSTGEAALDNKGSVVAPHSIKLSPQVGGEIVWLDPNFKEGAVYKKGARLAEIDPVIYVAQLNNAKAALEVARVNLEQVKTGSTLKDIAAAKALLKNLAAKVEYSKVDERNKRRAGAGTTIDDLEKATIQLQVDQAAHDNQTEIVAKLETLLQEQRRTAEQQLNAAQANVDQAEKNLKNCTIRAPRDGIILNKNAELGAYVNPLSYGSVAGYLCEMADLLDLEIDCDIPERDFKAIKITKPGVPGQRCLIMPDAGKDDAAFRKKHPNGYEGEVARRLPEANEGKGAVKVRVKVIFPKDEEGGEFLIPKMQALVTFLK
jgi:multidrug efflux pump subunit AcrA (membrane-fusion protein)